VSPKLRLRKSEFVLPSPGNPFPPRTKIEMKSRYTFEKLLNMPPMDVEAYIERRQTLRRVEPVPGSVWKRIWASMEIKRRLGAQFPDN